MAKKFKKGDNVLVIAGSDRGRDGKIISTVGDTVVVEGVRIAFLHKKPTSQQPGQIIRKERCLHISNISHVEEGKPIKIKFTIDKDKKGKDFAKKDRLSKKTGKKIN